MPNFNRKTKRMINCMPAIHELIQKSTKPESVVYVASRIVFGLIWVLLLPLPGFGSPLNDGVILRSVPAKVDTKARYLFYLHGYIVEAGNPRPTSPKFGVYEYEQILTAFSRQGLVVISEARQKDPEIEPYANKVASEVTQLINAGVPPRHITVIGASQGAWIAMLASTYLKNRNVNFVLIAACSAEPGFLNAVDLHGNVLSIYEKSDLAQSCRDYRADGTGINDWKEVAVNTGLKHGFLFRPMPEWTEPATAWAKR
jgi:pimeloyl-ACP methyl ester carboxylesterase